jgi:hypothetical protein
MKQHVTHTGLVNASQHHQHATLEDDMNYRTATTEQLRKERARLTSMQQMIQQRRDSSAQNRGGRDAGFRRGATLHQQDRELLRLQEQIAQLDAELVSRDQRAAAAANTQTMDESGNAAAGPATDV